MKLRAIAGLVAVAVFCELAGVSRGDGAVQSTPASRAGATNVAIQLRQVRPSVMAWWLDPTHQPSPVASLPKDGANPYAPLAAQPTHPGLMRLLGVERIIAVDSQNALIVRGTTDGVRQVETIVGNLDREQPRVQIEAYFVEVGETNARQFGIDFNDGPFAARQAPATSAFATGLVRGNFQAALDAMVQNKRARILNAPAFSTLNNLPGNMAVTNVVVKPESNTASDEQVLADFQLEAMPDVKSDGSIALQLRPVIRWTVTPGKGAPVSSQPSTLQVATTTNLSSGDTIALSLGQSPFVKQSRAVGVVPQNRVLLLFVKAQIAPMSQPQQ